MVCDDRLVNVVISQDQVHIEISNPPIMLTTLKNNLENDLRNNTSFGTKLMIDISTKEIMFVCL